MPKIIILAGPNGAGKTTFARQYLPGEASCLTFLNADLIAAGISPFAPEVAAIQAGRIMLESIAHHVIRNEGFAMETTLSGLGYARQIPRWRSLGFRVQLVFVSLRTADHAVRRVAERVRQGGHDIPEETIRRRFDSGKRLFHEVYRHIVDDWWLCDNTGNVPVLMDWSGTPMTNRIEEPAVPAGALPANANEETRGLMAALLRAAADAREVALKTGTDLIYFRDGKVVRVNPKDMTTRGPQPGN